MALVGRKASLILWAQFIEGKSYDPFPEQSQSTMMSSRKFDFFWPMEQIFEWRGGENFLNSAGD